MGDADVVLRAETLPLLSGGLLRLRALTELGSLTARFVRTLETLASFKFDELRLALVSAPVLRTFDPARRRRREMLTTDASSVAIPATPTQQDDARMRTTTRLRTRAAS